MTTDATRDGSDHRQFSGGQHFGPHYEGRQDHSTHSTGDGHTQITGSQVNVSHYYGLPEGLEHKMFRGAAPQPVNKASLGRLQKRFTTPAGYRRALLEIKEAGNTVVITGEPGSGRRTAAMMVLFESSSSWHEIPNEPGGEDELLLDLDSVEEGAGLLLDLSSREPDVIKSMLSRSISLRAEAVEKRCAVALVVPTDAVYLLDDELRRQVVPIERPNGLDAFKKHLENDSAEFTDADLGSRDLQSRLRTERMSEIARLSMLVKEARAASTGGGFQVWLNQALTVFSRQTEQVAGWLREHTDGRERALMLTAAMLEGASTDAVQAACNLLLDSMRFPPNETHVLERTGITERLAKLVITLDDRRRVRFPSRDYDQEMRTQFWLEHPDIRKTMHEWLTKAALLKELDRDSRNALVVRFAEQCLATGRHEDLSFLAEHWVRLDRNHRPSAILECVDLVLRAGLRHERFGAWFRRKIYEWATRPRRTDLPSDLDEVLVKLCGQVIVQSQPGQALVRLHHLARRDNEFVVEQAGNQIIELARDPFFFRRAMSRLVEEIDLKRIPRDMSLFLRLADPTKLLSNARRSQALIFDLGVRRQLVTGWRIVLAKPVSVWEGRVHDWLRAAADDHRGAALLDVLIEACHQQTTELGKLHGVSLRWGHAADGDERRRRSRTVADLTHRIDACQDLEFLTNIGEPA